MYDPSYTAEVQERKFEDDDRDVWRRRPNSPILALELFQQRINLGGTIAKTRQELLVKETVLHGPEKMPVHSYGYIEDESIDLGMQ